MYIIAPVAIIHLFERRHFWIYKITVNIKYVGHADLFLKSDGPQAMGVKRGVQAALLAITI